LPAKLQTSPLLRARLHLGRSEEGLVGLHESVPFHRADAKVVEQILTPQPVDGLLHFGCLQPGELRNSIEIDVEHVENSRLPGE
jgi:hypothetical protein